MRISLLLLSLFLLAGCGTSQVGTVGSGQTAVVKTIAMMPGGGVLADAVAKELAARGFKIVDSATTSSMLARLNLKETETSRPEGLSKLRDQGVDAILVVSGERGYDNQPQSASARMTSTRNGALIASVTWQNAFGGMRGSIADHVMRKGLSQAAIEMANELASHVTRA